MKNATVVLGINPNRRAAWAVATTLFLVLGALIWAFASGSLALVAHKQYSATVTGAVYSANNGDVSCQETVYISVGKEGLHRRIFTEGRSFTGGGFTGQMGVALVDKQEPAGGSRHSVRFSGDSWWAYDQGGHSDESPITNSCLFSRSGSGL